MAKCGLHITILQADFFKSAKKLQIRITKYLMCTYGGISVQNMKFLCLNLWLGEVCTDDANDDDGQSMIV